MTTLSQRKTRLHFMTSDLIRERGAYRPVVVEASPEVATMRLKGTQHRVMISWAALYQFAARCEADRARREKDAAKKARK